MHLLLEGSNLGLYVNPIGNLGFHSGKALMKLLGPSLDTHHALRCQCCTCVGTEQKF